MPLFFMVSGYCFNIAKHPKWLSFAMSRAWSLLVPCALYTVISLVVSPEYICEGKYYELKTLLPGALWFLPILFIVEDKNNYHVDMCGFSHQLSLFRTPIDV